MKDLQHEGLFGMGVQTFMKSQYICLNEIQNYDVVFLGVPWEQGASYRQGQAQGPNSIRKFSYWDGVKSGKFYDLDSREVLLSNNLKIGDLGDLHLPRTDSNQAFETIENTVAKISKKSFPLIVGGDHSISFSTIKAIKETLPASSKIAILHFDAHFDLEEEYLDFPSVFHGNPFSALINGNYLQGKDLYTVGLRGIVPHNLIDYALKHKTNFYTTKEINNLGIECFADKLLKALGNYDYVYVTFDIDCLDSSEIKGTGTPRIDGLSSSQAEYLLRRLHHVNCIGFELVELSPALDPSGYSCIVATNLLWNFLSFGYKK